MDILNDPSHILKCVIVTNRIILCELKPLIETVGPARFEPLIYCY